MAGRGRPRIHPPKSAEEMRAIESRRKERENDLALRAQLKSGSHPGQTGALEAFERFATDSRERKFRPLSAEAVEAYRGVWLQWLMHLAGLQIHWQSATAKEVLSFLEERTPRSRRRAPGIEVSAATEGRYARILHGIYRMALPEDERHRNPVRVGETGLTLNESVESLRLHVNLRAALRKSLPVATDMASARDRAVICLAVFEGLSCADITGLRLESLLFSERDCAGLGGSAQGEVGADGMRAAYAGGGRGELLFTPSGAPTGLHVRGSREAQDRRLGLHPETSRSLARWLEYRSESSGAELTDALILSLSRRRPAGGGGPVASYSMLFKVCAQHVERALTKANVMAAEDVRRLVHIGPNVLRNACLLEWLERGVELEEVRRRAGLKEVRSLARLMENHRDLAEIREAA